LEGIKESNKDLLRKILQELSEVALGYLDEFTDKYPV
jgi:hypothetical protein